MLESSRVPTVVLGSFFVFMVLAAAGLHRSFTIYPDGVLLVTSANPFMPSKIKIGNIRLVEVTKTSVTFYFFDQKKSKTYHMRKWPKKYFVNALALNPHFTGEVELTDHLIHLDYFEEYYQQPRKNKGS